MSDSSHIVWPAAIIGLLLFSALTVVAILVASRSDGGAKVVNDYYEKSVAWDSIAAVRTQSENLGWRSSATVVRSPDESYGMLTIKREDGSPISGLTAEIAISRPQSNEIVGVRTAHPLVDQPGSYRFDFPFAERGLWDLEIVASLDEVRYNATIRIEV